MQNSSIKAPLVSIIIPLYNAEEYINECIDSALAQTWPHKEIIVVNDGSTDGSLAKAKKYESEMVKVVSQENGGASKARNLGFSLSTGTYIQFLDADDFIDPNKVTEQIAALMDFPQHLAVCSTFHFNNGDFAKGNVSEYEDSFLFDTDQPADFLIKLWGGDTGRGSMVQPNAWLIPRRLLNKAGMWNEELSIDDDGEFFTRVILSAKGIIKVDGVFNYYRKFKSATSLSSIKNYNSFSANLEAILQKKKQLFKYNQDKRAKSAIARQLIPLAVSSYPKYPELTKRIIQEIDQLGKYSYTPINGGPLLRNLSRLLGWKLTRLIENLIKNR